MHYFTEIKLAMIIWVWVIVAFIFIASLVAYSVGRDIIRNWAAFLVLKAKTSYQFQNAFILDGRNCQIKSMRPTEVVVLDIDTLDERALSTPDFKKAHVWRNPPTRRVWNEVERDSHREAIKEKTKENWTKNKNG